MPDVCVSKWRIVTSAHVSGVSFKCLLILSSTDSLPSCASSRIPAAVNCLVIEPISKTVSRFVGTFSSMFRSEMLADLVINRQLALLRQQQDSRCRELLGDRANLKDGFTLRRHVQLDVCQAVGRSEEHTSE